MSGVVLSVCRSVCSSQSEGMGESTLIGRELGEGQSEMVNNLLHIKYCLSE